MVICAENRKLHIAVGRVGNYSLLALECHKHSHFSNAVEIDVICTDKLVNLRVLTAPEIRNLLHIPASVL